MENIENSQAMDLLRAWWSDGRQLSQMFALQDALTELGSPVGQLLNLLTSRGASEGQQEIIQLCTQEEKRLGLISRAYGSSQFISGEKHDIYLVNMRDGKWYYYTPMFHVPTFNTLAMDTYWNWEENKQYWREITVDQVDTAVLYFGFLRMILELLHNTSSFGLPMRKGEQLPKLGDV